MKIRLIMCVMLTLLINLPFVQADQVVQQHHLFFTLPLENLEESSVISGELSSELVLQLLKNADPTLNSRSAVDELSWAIIDSGGVELPSPAITQSTGQSAGAYAISNLQYMEQKDDGSFDLKMVDPRDQPGVFLDVVVDKTNDDDKFNYDYTLRIRIMTGRRELPGSNLPIGEPEFKDFNLKDRLVVVAGEWVLVDAFKIVDVNPDESSVLFVMLQLNPL